MKLYVKEKAISLTDAFNILDDDKHTVFKARTQLISLGKTIHLTDNDNQEVATIHQKLLTHLPTFEIECGNMKGRIICKERGGRDTYFFNGPDWRIEGDFRDHEYRIFSLRGPVAEITKKLISFTDCYRIDCMRMTPQEIPAVVCAVLVIDLMQEAKEKGKK